MNELPDKTDQPLQPLEYAVPQPRRWVLALAVRRMFTKRNAVLLMVGIVVAVLVALRWPRFKDDSALVTECIASDDTMTLELRMRDPFEVALNHHLGPRPTFGANIPDAEPKREPAGRFRSHYDILRGEYYARLRFKRGEKLEVESGGTRVNIQPWSVAHALSAKWELLSEGELIGRDVGIYVVRFKGTATQDEYIDLRAGDPPDQFK